MSGQALTAGELARHAGVTAQTTSGHLGKLTEAKLIAVEKQGRHRYYRLATPQVAQAIHALMAVAASGPTRYHPIGPRDQALRLARTCYDHMAGRLALTIADSLVREGHVVLSDGAGMVTDEGRRFFADLGIDTKSLRARRPLCQTCLDWSERRPHIAGQLGAALLSSVLARGWVTRSAESRALKLSRAGESGLATAFQLPADWRNEGPFTRDVLEPEVRGGPSTDVLAARQPAG
ncbi:ArsR/SmtB family transcription factor [Paracoccus suum]|nr:helix-turn-helix domain-containing protein [Paracoccus suum]